jgi:hypothetical protein
VYVVHVLKGRPGWVPSSQTLEVIIKAAPELTQPMRSEELCQESVGRVSCRGVLPSEQHAQRQPR